MNKQKSAKMSRSHKIIGWGDWIPQFITENWYSKNENRDIIVKKQILNRDKRFA